MTVPHQDMIRIREALEGSWDASTAYLGVHTDGIPSLGQCYPTARVLQLLLPQLEIVEGQVWTGIRAEKHFWNLLEVAGHQYHIDLTWQQFPPGSVVESWRVRDREALNDSETTLTRVHTLLERVTIRLQANQGSRSA